MTNNGFELTRRRLLAATGTVGLTSVGAGLGTSAFFSDEETFDGNALVAGELDLKVDWEEHYSDWSDDESDGLEFDPVMDLSEIPDSNPDGLSPDPTDPDNWIAFPPRLAELLYVWVGDTNQFMHNTSIEAYPDSDGDGIQDTIKTRQQVRTDNPFLSEEQIERLYREQFADVPDDLQGRAPLIDLTDVKPGDFGEVTFSMHLFNNPGYLWLTGRLLSAAENGITEPEADDPDEEETESRPASGDSSTDEVELLDEVRVALWHDDGNNVFTDPEVVVHRKPVDGPDSEENISLAPAEALITQGTLREVLQQLSQGHGLPLDSDPSTQERDCFPNSTTRFIALAWWLPVDHANEIQGDSVTFDLGFYTEQCRHNDGSGMLPELTVENARVGGPTQNSTAGVLFDITNPGPGAIEIRRARVSTTAQTASLLSDDVSNTGSRWGYEFYLDTDPSGDGTSSSDGRIDVDGGSSLPSLLDLTHDSSGGAAIGFNDGADFPATFADGQSATASLYAFRDGGGNAVDMNGETVQLELTLARPGETETTTQLVTLSL
ncbi:hypothetical protein [Haloarchaeobius sp. TZWSO28]|uniref:hypothetical protein n=1 Tax=Haloarchaeobius sp. TZWSO28 TaxID=3446119 RepID=UPI003EB8261F